MYFLYWHELGTNLVEFETDIEDFNYIDWASIEG